LLLNLQKEAALLQDLMFSHT